MPDQKIFRQKLNAINMNRNDVYPLPQVSELVQGIAREQVNGVYFLHVVQVSHRGLWSEVVLVNWFLLERF